jgi:DNA-binding MarR family transcriptional regulator
MAVETAVDAALLQAHVAAFVRAFGLHRPDETPCGEPVPVSEAHALGLLAGGGPMTQTELARGLGLQKSTVSRLVGQLAARGWAERRSSPTDARCRLVGLTTAGEAAAGRLAVSRAERMRRLLARIPEADREAVLSALVVLTEAAREE